MTRVRGAPPPKKKDRKSNRQGSLLYLPGHGLRCQGSAGMHPAGLHSRLRRRAAQGQLSRQSQPCIYSPRCRRYHLFPSRHRSISPTLLAFFSPLSTIPNFQWMSNDAPIKLPNTTSFVFTSSSARGGSASREGTPGMQRSTTEDLFDLLLDRVTRENLLDWLTMSFSSKIKNKKRLQIYERHSRLTLFKAIFDPDCMNPFHLSSFKIPRLLNSTMLLKVWNVGQIFLPFIHTTGFIQSFLGIGNLEWIKSKDWMK